MLSPDGRYRWDGYFWQPYPAAGQTNLSARLRTRRSRARFAIAAVLILFGVTTAAAPVWLSPLGTDLSALPFGPFRSGPSPQLQAFIPVAEKFVEDHRGLKFESPPKITFLTDSQFQAEVIGPPPDSSEQSYYRRSGNVLRALGLIDPGVDLLKEETSLGRTSIIGLYDPDSKQLYVRGVQFGPEVQHVLVHELTHALQDQHFSISLHPTNATNDEATLAFRGLLEGDAVRIEDEYIATLTDEQRTEIQQAESQLGAAPAVIPRNLVEILDFPYVAGPDFIKAITDAKGQAGLDTAFVDRPTATAQLIHPDRYLAGMVPKSVPTPTADGPQIDDGVLGELDLRLMLHKLITSGQSTSSDVNAAASTWAGDHYVAWTSGSQTCVRTILVTDTVSDGAVLARVLRSYATSRSGVTVEASGASVTMTTCG